MSQPVSVMLTNGPLGPRPPASPTGGEGARLVFEGVVRPTEAERPLAALLYEAYEPMTTRELRALAERVVARHGLLALRVEHSTGRVPVGQVSFRLAVDSEHRAEGLRAAGDFIDQMKRDVPLWKTPEFADGSTSR